MPDHVVMLPTPQTVIDDSDFRNTSKVIVKQSVGIRLCLDVTEYHADVFICVLPDGTAIYSARKKKGGEGVNGTVAEDYQGILVHDHEITFYNYGSGHQECLSHILRYLKDSIDNEPGRKWSGEMQVLVKEMIHYGNGLADASKYDTVKIENYKEQYRQILQKAKDEYEYVLPNDYYRDGYNLYLRTDKYMNNHLLFLTDHRVPTTNNEAERLLRKFKRKQTQAVSFRSFDSIDYLCRSMSMLCSLHQKGTSNIYDRVSQIFS